MNLYESIKNNLKESINIPNLTIDTRFLNNKNKGVKITNLTWNSDKKPIIHYEVYAQDYDKEPKVEYVRETSLPKEEFLEMLKAEGLIQKKTREETLKEDFGYDKILNSIDLGDETEFTIENGGDITTVRIDDNGNIYIK